MSIQHKQRYVSSLVKDGYKFNKYNYYKQFGGMEIKVTFNEENILIECYNNSKLYDRIGYYYSSFAQKHPNVIIDVINNELKSWLHRIQLENSFKLEL